MAILYAADPDDASAWIASLHALDAGLEIRCWPDWGDPGEIDFVIIGGGSPGDLGVFPGLKAIQSTWAGVNHLLASAGLPRGVPIARMVDRGLTGSMTEFVAFHVLDELRRGPELRRAQSKGEWLDIPARSAATMSVAILGLGALGSDVARKLVGLGFNVRGWSRTRKPAADGVAGFAGVDELPALLGGVEVLVCLLPLTAGTTNILDRHLFSLVPPGTLIINVGRGAQLDEAGLLAALEEGRIGRAVLDVFREEPLPEDHPFWRHPGIQVSPHVAAITRAGTGAADILENYRRATSGQGLLNVVNIANGY